MTLDGAKCLYCLYVYLIFAHLLVSENTGTDVSGWKFNIVHRISIANRTYLDMLNSLVADAVLFV